MRSPVTLTVRALEQDTGVTAAFPTFGSQPLVAIVEIKNSSHREFIYSAWYERSDIPYFTVRYRDADGWKEDADAAHLRGMVESHAAVITGYPWCPCNLKPGESISFKADILRPNRECRVVVDFRVTEKRNPWYNRLPQWVVTRLPWVRDHFQVETKTIPNASHG
jgi:hypothetical protein